MLRSCAKPTLRCYHLLKPTAASSYRSIFQLRSHSNTSRNTIGDIETDLKAPWRTDKETFQQVIDKYSASKENMLLLQGFLDHLSKLRHEPQLAAVENIGKKDQGASEDNPKRPRQRAVDNPNESIILVITLIVLVWPVVARTREVQAECRARAESNPRGSARQDDTMAEVPVRQTPSPLTKIWRTIEPAEVKAQTEADSIWIKVEATRLVEEKEADWSFWKLGNLWWAIEPADVKAEREADIMRSVQILQEKDAEAAREAEEARHTAELERDAKEAEEKAEARHAARVINIARLRAKLEELELSKSLWWMRDHRGNIKPITVTKG